MVSLQNTLSEPCGSFHVLTFKYFFFSRVGSMSYFLNPPESVRSETWRNLSSVHFFIIQYLPLQIAQAPSKKPSSSPRVKPTQEPTQKPTLMVRETMFHSAVCISQSSYYSKFDSRQPSSPQPIHKPTIRPTGAPTPKPHTALPTPSPTAKPTANPMLKVRKNCRNRCWVFF